MDYKKLLENALSQSQLNTMPEETQNEVFHIFRGDLNPERDWKNFIEGQKVNHTYYEKSFKGSVDTQSLEFGASENSFYSLLTENETIEVYTSNYEDLTGKYISIGDDVDKKYLAISFKLTNFSTEKDKKENLFTGKIILVDIIKYLSQQVDDGIVAPTINIVNGKMGETIQLPQRKTSKDGDIGDPSVKDYKTIDQTIKKPKSVEVFYSNPAVFIGMDFISNNSENKAFSANGIVEIESGTSETTIFPKQELISILPTQWAIPSVDNYGFTHPADPANSIKTILATQSLKNGINTATSTGQQGGLLSSLGASIVSSAIGLGQRYFGDKGTLANALATTPKIATSDSDSLKFFIQADGTAITSTGITENGYLNNSALILQDDYIELNQASGEFGKIAKPMSPSQNEDYNSTIKYRALGLRGSTTGNPPVIAAPYATGYNNLVINETKISDFIKSGVIRNESAGSNKALKQMQSESTWRIYIRQMFFRPDPYSYWNWGALMPADIGVYELKNTTSIHYDTESFDFDEEYGTENSNVGRLKSGNWNKTILLGQLTTNDFPNPNNTHLSLRFNFNAEQEHLFKVESQAFTASTIEYAFLDKEGKVIRLHKMKSRGAVAGTSAKMISTHYL